MGGVHAASEPVPVRHQQGTMRGFLEVRSQKYGLIAWGEFIQVAHGDRITAETIFHFKDGSIDQETTVFSQRRHFKLISDHHIQKGAFFPHPMETWIDAQKKQVIVHSTGKDGKEQTKTDHLDLPPDLANGMLPLIVENAAPDAQQTTVSMVAFTPSPRLVKCVISPIGETPFSVAGTSLRASQFQLKFDLGVVTGALAHLTGKQPPDIHFWILGGTAPLFLREQGPTYDNGPILSIDLAGLSWDD